MIILKSYLILIVIFFITKFTFVNLKSKFYENHQKLAGKESIPLIGGVIIFFFYNFQLINIDNNFIIFSFLILVLGILSDNNLLKSPKLRLLFQALILLTYVFVSNINIIDLKNELINNLLSLKYFNLFFTSFCLLILINGSNFIDGLDGLNLGYFLIIIIVLLHLDNSYELDLDKKLLLKILIFVSFLLLFNFLNFLYLGDSGSYLLGFIFGIFLINLDFNNHYISPYFIALLLWYPAFENLFSIVRKKFFKKNPLDPDNLHFHQLLFNFIQKSKNKFISKYANPISSSMIIIYNFIIFLSSTKYVNYSKVLFIFLFGNILMYLIIYRFLKKNN